MLSSTKATTIIGPFVLAGSTQTKSPPFSLLKVSQEKCCWGTAQEKDLVLHLHPAWDQRYCQPQTLHLPPPLLPFSATSFRSHPKQGGRCSCYLYSKLQGYKADQDQRNSVLPLFYSKLPGRLHVKSLVAVIYSSCTRTPQEDTGGSYQHFLQFFHKSSLFHAHMYPPCSAELLQWH